MSSLAKAVPRTDATRRFISLQRRQSLVGLFRPARGRVLCALQFLRWGTHSISASRAGIFLRRRGGSVSRKLHHPLQRPELLSSLGITLRYTLNQLCPWFCCRSGWRCF